MPKQEGGPQDTQPVREPEHVRDTSLDDMAAQYMSEPDTSLDDMAVEALMETEEDNTALRGLLKGLAELRKPELQEQVRSLGEKLIRARRDARRARRNERDAVAREKEKDRVIDDLLEGKEEAERAANHDKLTGMLNRHGGYVELLEKHLMPLGERLKQLDTLPPEERDKAKLPQMDIILIDLDHFKRFNDTYGHQVGDRVLKIAAKTIQSALHGKDDIAFRWGGEEFMVILPDSAPGLAGRVAERIRREIEKLHLIIDAEKGVAEDLTASIGFSHFDNANQLAREIKRNLRAASGERLAIVEELFEKDAANADEALYIVKDSGRNNIWPSGGIEGIEEPVPPPPRKEVIDVYL